MKIKYSIDNISELKISLNKPNIIFLKGDLGAGKTTLTKHILQNILKVEKEIISPTYTYYNKYQGFYNNQEKVDIYHFDLYRLENYDEFFAIGAEDIFDNNKGIIFVEWPDLIEKYYKPDLEIYLEKTEKIEERIISLKEN